MTKKKCTALIAAFCMLLGMLLVQIATQEVSAAGFIQLENDDFSNIANGTQLTAGGTANPGNWKLLYYSGASAVNDPIVYYDGGIKYTKSAKGGNLILYKDMSETAVTTGTVVYSFDAKFKNPVGSDQIYWEDYFLRLGANIPTPGDRTNNLGLCYSGMMAKAGMVIMPKGGAANQAVMQNLLGTENKNHHFEYTIDYDAGTYSVKVDDTFIASSGKTVFPIPDDFLANGGAKYFMISMRLQSVSTIADFELELKNFTVTTGGTMWPKQDALTVSDITASSAKLTWHPLATDGVTGYEIYQGDTLAATVTDTSYELTGLSAGTNYTISVKPLFSDSRAYDSAPEISFVTGGFAAREGNLLQVSAGRTHLLGINQNERTHGFGDNSFGQLAAFPGQTKAVAAGYDSSYAVDENGKLYAWGNNYSGQLGIGSEALMVENPTVVSKLENVLSVAAGAEHALALTADGNVYAWGDNRYGQLGCGSAENMISEPVQIPALSGKGAVSICAGKYTSYAVCANGDLYAWGMNYAGQLGNGDDALDNQSVPVLISVLGQKVLSVSAGGGHAVAICYSDANGNGTYDEGEEKSVWGWGSDSRAQLGTGALSTWYNAPVRLTFFDDIEVVSLAAGEGHTLALTADGTVYAWGWNENGQLGLGHTNFGLTPTVVANLPGIRSIAAGYTYSLAVGTDGSLWGWGDNASGQIDDSGAESIMTPAKIKLPLGDILFGTTMIGTSETVPETGGSYAYAVSVYHNGKQTFDGKILTCVYRENGEKRELLGVYPTELALEPEQEETVSGTVTLPQNTENVLIQIFAWDANFAPYAENCIIR
ncbi:MAG: fibronectin type III domain-containing protein [Clostridia bacterium]|nr:fibronectin type III domain-containing protein [Clostridia bacterium]